MATQEKDAYILKMLSGPNLGAEMVLEDGEYVLGRSPECDVVLSDTTVADKHLKLSVHNRTILLTPLSENTFLDGVKAKEQELKPYQVVTAGTTNFAITLENGPAEEIKIPVLSEVSLPAAGGKALQQQTPKEEEAQPAPLAHTLLTSHKTRTALTIALIILVFAGGAVSFWSAYGRGRKAHTPSRQALPSPANKEKAARQVLSSLQMDQLKVDFRKGALYITGYVKTKDDKMHLAAALQKSGITAIVDVTAMEEILQAVRGVINAMGLSLSVDSPGNGVVRLTGFTATDDALRQFKQTIVNDIPGIQRVDDSVATTATIMTETDTMLAQADLQKTILIKGQGHTILAQGVLDEPGKKKWDKILQQMVQKYGKYVTFNENISIERLNVIYEECRTNKFDTYVIINQGVDIVTNIPQCYTDEGGN